MTEFVEIAQANFARAEKEKARLAKEAQVEKVLNQFEKAAKLLIFMFCAVSIAANLLLLIMIALDLLSR